MSAFTEPERPANLQIRYVNLSGAVVDVTGSGDHARDNTWTCRGCKDSSHHPTSGWLWQIRQSASDHAAACRAIPLT